MKGPRAWGSQRLGDVRPMGEAGFMLKGQAWGTGPRTEGELEGSAGLCPLVPKQACGAAPDSLAPVSREPGTPCPRRSLNQAWRLRAGMPHPLGVRRAPGAWGRPEQASAAAVAVRWEDPGLQEASPPHPRPRRPLLARLLFVLRRTDTRTQRFGPLDARSQEGQSVDENS